MPGLAGSCAVFCGLLLFCGVLSVVAEDGKLPTATVVEGSWWGRAKAALTVNDKSKGADDARLALFVQDNRAIDDIVLGLLLPHSVRSAMPSFVACWFRMLFLSVVLYFGIGLLWCYYAYFCFGKDCFGKGGVPSISDMREQIQLASWGIPWFAFKDALTELAVERGWTKAYSRLDETTLPQYFINFCLYLAFTEFCVYWSHRLMHDIPYLYRTLHHDHHTFNKADSLSPFAGIAHNPIDGILQVGWYSVGLFVVPMHFPTHLAALIWAMMWTHCLHDCLDARLDPIMGSGFHALHHVMYKNNYGQFFIYFDWLFGTLTTPEEFESNLRCKSSVEVVAPKTEGVCDKKYQFMVKKVGKGAGGPKSKKNKGLKRNSSFKRRNSARKNRRK